MQTYMQKGKHIDSPEYESPNHIHLTDIEVAATLLAKGYPLLSINKSSRGKATFIFESQEGITAVIDGYWFNRVDVHPLEFATARKNLKSRLFAMETIRY